jgi:ABC-type uncharacterized transport system permease subunit
MHKYPQIWLVIVAAAAAAAAAARCPGRLLPLATFPTHADDVCSCLPALVVKVSCRELSIRWQDVYQVVRNTLLLVNWQLQQQAGSAHLRQARHHTSEPVCQKRMSK